MRNFKLSVGRNPYAEITAKSALDETKTRRRRVSAKKALLQNQEIEFAGVNGCVTDKQITRRVSVYLFDIR
jgi:hypothetical protein